MKDFNVLSTRIISDILKNDYEGTKVLKQATPNTSDRMHIHGRYQADAGVNIAMTQK